MVTQDIEAAFELSLGGSRHILGAGPRRAPINLGASNEF